MSSFFFVSTLITGEPREPLGRALHTTTVLRAYKPVVDPQLLFGAADDVITNYRVWKIPCISFLPPHTHT